ncbi:MAG TPA: glycerophosphodiester phosphodiesterase [Armatimonadota bacterium]
MAYHVWSGPREVGHGFIWVGHRGAASLAPANTASSFEAALALGVDLVEVDLRRTADGVLVLAHDACIKASGGRELEVAASALEELQRVDLGQGECVPTLRDAIRQVLGRAGLMIDLKLEGAEEQLVDEVRAEGLRQVIVPGGTPFSRERLRSLDPGLPISLSLDLAEQPLVTAATLAQTDVDAFTLHHRLVTPELVRAAHDSGRLAFAWTVDDAERMLELLDMGVDGLISNRPQVFAGLHR